MPRRLLSSLRSLASHARYLSKCRSAPTCGAASSNRGSMLLGPGQPCAKRAMPPMSPKPLVLAYSTISAMRNPDCEYDYIRVQTVKTFNDLMCLCDKDNERLLDCEARFDECAHVLGRRPLERGGVLALELLTRHRPPRLGVRPGTPGWKLLLSVFRWRVCARVHVWF